MKRILAILGILFLIFLIGYILIPESMIHHLAMKGTVNRYYTTSGVDSSDQTVDLDRDIPNEAVTLNSPLQEELNLAKEDSNIVRFYKQVLEKEQLIEADDSLMFSITDSLLSKNQKHDFFYFLVFTKSMNGADGFYSEALGLNAYEFVSNHTERFADYFNVGPELTEADLQNWASCVYGEIQIEQEGRECEAIQRLSTKCIDNLKGSRKEYLNVMEKFIERLETHCDIRLE